MKGPARYVLCIDALPETGASPPDFLKRLFGDLPGESIARSLVQDVVAVDASLPLLETSQLHVNFLPEVAAELAELADSYLGLMRETFQVHVLADVKDEVVSILAQPWGEFPAGSVAYRMRTNLGVLIYLRNDVIVSPSSGKVFHLRPAVHLPLKQAAIEDGSFFDSALTIAEYASFMIPGPGAIVAGVISVFHSWLRKRAPSSEMPNERVVEEVAALLRQGQVQTYQGLLTGAYKNYRSAFANANDLRPKSVENFAMVVQDTIGQNAPLSLLTDILVHDGQLLNDGIVAWSFAASFRLLALRHALVLEAHRLGSASAESDTHRRLALAYEEYVAHAIRIATTEMNGLAERLSRISDVRPLMIHRVRPVKDTDGIPYMSHEGYCFLDGDKQVGQRNFSKKKKNSEVEAECRQDLAAYVGKARAEYLKAFYAASSESDALKTRAMVLDVMSSWQESHEDFILSHAAGWHPPQDYPAISTWQAGSTAPPLEIKGEGTAKCGTWNEPASAESMTGFFGPSASCWFSIGVEGKLHLKVPLTRKPNDENYKHYALRLRCVPREGRRLLRVYWAGKDEGPDSSRARAQMVSASRHVDKNDHVWLSRTITIVMQGPELVASGATHADLVLDAPQGWAPDVLSVEWFDLHQFPDVG